MSEHSTDDRAFSNPLFEKFYEELGALMDRFSVQGLSEELMNTGLKIQLENADPALEPMRVLKVDPSDPEQYLIPLTCGHQAAVYNRSSGLDHPMDDVWCTTCQAPLYFTPEAQEEMRRLV